MLHKVKGPCLHICWLATEERYLTLCSVLRIFELMAHEDQVVLGPNRPLPHITDFSVQPSRADDDTTLTGGEVKSIRHFAKVLRHRADGYMFLSVRISLHDTPHPLRPSRLLTVPQFRLISIYNAEARMILALLPQDFLRSNAEASSPDDPLPGDLTISIGPYRDMTAVDSWVMLLDEITLEPVAPPKISSPLPEKEKERPIEVNVVGGKEWALVSMLQRAVRSVRQVCVSFGIFKEG